MCKSKSMSGCLCPQVRQNQSMLCQKTPRQKIFTSWSAPFLFLQGAIQRYFLRFKVFWDSLNLISVESLWQLDVQPRNKGGNPTDRMMIREGGEGEEGGKQILLLRGEFLHLPREKAPFFQTSQISWAANPQSLLGDNPFLPPLLLPGTDTFDFLPLFTTYNIIFKVKQKPFHEVITEQDHWSDWNVWQINLLTYRCFFF